MAVYDLAVVGVGPGGMATSIAAARQGLNVILFEKREKGRDKYCGGGSTLKTLGVDELDFGFVTEGYGFVIHGEHILVTAIKGHMGMTVRRCDLDKVLMERAESEGVEFKEKTEVVGIKEKNNEIVLMDDRGEKYKSRYLVLATGMEERLILSLGFPPLPRETLGQCWGTEKPYDVNEQVAKWRKEYGITPIWIFMGGVGISYGYFWVFPKKGFMNVGMGVLITEAKRGLHEKGYKAGLE